MSRRPQKRAADDCAASQITVKSDPINRRLSDLSHSDVMPTVEIQYDLVSESR
jgi:hypothetical protein